MDCSTRLHSGLRPQLKRNAKNELEESQTAKTHFPQQEFWDAGAADSRFFGSEKLSQELQTGPVRRLGVSEFLRSSLKRCRALGLLGPFFGFSLASRPSSRDLAHRSAQTGHPKRPKPAPGRPVLYAFCFLWVLGKSLL